MQRWRNAKHRIRKRTLYQKPDCHALSIEKLVTVIGYSVIAQCQSPILFDLC